MKSGTQGQARTYKAEFELKRKVGNPCWSLRSYRPPALMRGWAAGEADPILALLPGIGKAEADDLAAGGGCDAFICPMSIR